MGWPATQRLIWAIAAALLATLLRPHEHGSSSATYSEAVCWALLLVFTELIQRSPHLGWAYNHVFPTKHQTYLPWLMAACISLSTQASSFDTITWVLPAIAPLVLVLRRTSYLPRLSHSTVEPLRSQWLCIGIGAISVLALAQPYNAVSIAIGCTALVGFVGLYAMLIRAYESNDTNLGNTSRLSLISLVRAVASCTAGVLAISSLMMAFLWSTEATPPISTLIAGGLKAVHWIFMFWIAQTIPWELGPTILTFAGASHNIIDQTASSSVAAIRALALFFVALAALYQIVAFLPKSTSGRNLLIIFAIWPSGTLLYQLSSNDRLGFLPGAIWPQVPKPSSKHPIEELIMEAQSKFDHLVQSQSQDLQAAELQYRKRYSREPPPGFDKWFAFAKSKHSVLIDDYDMIDEDLKPFWQISPERLLESIDHVTSFEHLALRKCGFTDGEYHGQGGGWIVEDLGHKLLDEVSHDLPNVEFAFDVIDEPRVIINEQILDGGGVAKPEFRNAEHRSIWSQATARCQEGVTSRYAPTVFDYDIPFVQDWYQAKDVCEHPEFAEMHGFFASPETCILTDAPIPILSQAAPTSFGDIMYPSPWYPAKVDQGVYKPDADPAWEQKTNTLYWAGSTTGSHSWNGSWRHSQRQRFVQLVQALNETDHVYLKQDTPGSWRGYKAIEDHSALFDVKLTAIIQCDEMDCAEQREFFSVHDKEDREQQFKSRYIFDLDGNSFSGRFYTLLKSRSVVLKQTVLREWHDERLIPWVHYVPISMGMQELPEIMRYLTSEEGGQLAKRIADQSREGHERMLRKEDMTVYLYRLMLELARIMDPERKVQGVT